MSEFGENTRIFGDPSEKSREEIVEKAVSWMSHGAEYSLQFYKAKAHEFTRGRKSKEAKQEYGNWFVEALHKDERLKYHNGYETWARY